ncbi:MAG: aspartate carbamoyltransferase [Patescibacteria group bacterium]|nr:aspartate carbamoyltransferase [Patescibacteria group bacterium]MDD4304347.1 aspartate carbamoyltransferase [Patescibacteria group bacterium]MDD4695370.1 aspartate carbamoyltransferase [Patescibacteria group bacterium]
MKNLISISDLSREEILHILNLAEQIEAGTLKPDLDRKICVIAFLEESTRTVGSFQRAVLEMNGQIISFLGKENNSINKGEDARDSIRTMAAYGDFIVMRVLEEGLPRIASEIINKTIINGGDGANQHPSQALLDVYAIQKTQGKLENLTIGFIGDLKNGRTVHSLVQAMSFFHPKFKFISDPSLKIPASFTRELDEQGVEYEELTEIEDVLNELDICYMTRIQRNRFGDNEEEEYNRVKGSYILKASMLENVKPNLKILHPLPRVDEIARDVDTTSYAYYWEQLDGGIPIRKAIIYTCILEEVK